MRDTLSQMATKKKRNKKYTGADAAVTRKTVTRISVPDRSPFGKWWHENRKKVSSRLAIIAFILISYGLISLLFRFDGGMNMPKAFRIL